MEDLSLRTEALQNCSGLVANTHIVFDQVQLLGPLLKLLRDQFTAMGNGACTPSSQNASSTIFYGRFPGTGNPNDSIVSPIVTI